MEYYIYIYLDPRKPGVYIYDNYTFDFEPIYVGKGKNRRYKQHIRQCLLHPHKSIFYRKLNNILKEHKPIYFILEGNLSNENACKKEIELIKLIGRLNIKAGTLCNLTNGGDGTTGYILSEQTKEKIRQIHIGHKRWKNIKHPMKDKTFDEYFGIVKSNELKEKISISLKNGKAYWKGKNLTDETKQKISETLKKRFKNKENHSRYGKKLSDDTKQKISKSNKEYWKNNPHTDDFKKMMSIKNSGENNPSFIVYTIINETTNESIELMGRDSVISYIMKYKEKNKILPKKSPSYIKLLSCGESYPFTLTKFKLNKK